MKTLKAGLLILAIVISLVACNDSKQVNRQSSRPYATQQSEINSSDASNQTDTIASTDSAVSKRTTSAGTPINDSFNWNDVYMMSTPASTCFSEIGYNNESEILVVRFLDSGSAYAYYDVPYSVWNELKNAQSVGGYYNSNIKGQYECEKIE